MRPFTDVLREHRNGRLVEHLSKRLTEVVAKVQATGKSGEITLKLKITPSKGDEPDAFEVTPNVTCKLPEADLAKALFYADEDSQLVRESPTQRSIFDGRDDELGEKRNRRHN